jgi:hypothetical protein
MKTFVKLCAVATLILAGATAQAADRKVVLPLADAMATPEAKSQLDGSVWFYFGKQPTPTVIKSLGAEKTSQKTNAFNKSDAVACNWVFLSAMLRLQKAAKDAGANAVINIVSNYKNVEVSSETDFECHAGALMAGVALKGEFVKIADK